RAKNNRECSAAKSLTYTREPRPESRSSGVPGALMRVWGATRTRGLRLENTLDPLAVPAVALAAFSRWTEFRVQQQIRCDADDNESDDKYRHPIVHFPLPLSVPRTGQ